jgi:uncharacterized membrane protein
MDQLWQFFFKHKWAAFAKGQFGFINRPSFVFIVILLLLAGALIYFLYLRPGAPSRRLTSPWQGGLVALRVGLFALIAILLMRPVMVVPSVIPKSSYVAFVADDSRSMQLNDEQGRTRIQAVKDLLNPNTSFSRGIEAKYKTAFYGFSSATAKIKDPNELKAEGKSTDLAGAFQEVVKDSTGIPLSAIVVVTDGSANTPRDLAAQLRELKARNLPVFTIGVGSPERFKDAEMVRVTAPRRVLVGSAVSAEALVRLSGYGQSKVAIAVSEDGRAIKTEQFDVRGGEAQSVIIEFTPAAAGPHRYTFAVTPLEGETTTENNAQEALIQVTDGHPKVLYIEGEPRWEYSFMRKALAKNEKNVILVSSLRSADGKFYRQGVESGKELESGFPKTDEEMFIYQGLILGSVEANFFTYEQLQMIERFVARRGGGFLAIGGTRAFDAGKYANTPIADLLPLYLNDQIEEAEVPEVANFKAALTPRGHTHPITRLNEKRDLSAKAWEELPPITVPEALMQTKPGATVVLEARNIRDRNRAVPLLAEERYGRGRTMALAASDTWRWRMQLDAKNTSHESFWRQMLRYLVSTTPGPVEVASERDVYTTGDPVKLHAEVGDKKYEPVKDAQITARITKPSGATIEVPMQFNFGEEANDYRGEFTPEEMGLHKLELSAKRGNESLGASSSSFLVTELNREFHDAAQNVELLKRIAAETGGQYHPLSNANDLIDELTYLGGNNSERVSLELWDMPINFMLLIALVSAEWFLRKRKGLA